MNGAAWAAALEASALGAWMRGSSWAYPAVNLLHLLGLVLLVGSMVLLDLRLLGVGRRLHLPDVSALLTPVAVAGLLIMLASGALLFTADAGPLSMQPLLQLKLLWIALGVGNALLFRGWWAGRLADWDARPPLLGRVQAAASLLIWLGVAAMGRMIAYV